MKALAMCLALVVFISALVFAAANGLWPLVSAQMAVGAVCLAAWGYGRARRVERRVGALGAVLAEHYRMGRPSVDISMITAFVDTEELYRARKEYLARRNLDMAMRYANGDASDY